MNKRPAIHLLACGLLSLFLAACLRPRPTAAPNLTHLPMKTCFQLSPFPVPPDAQDSAKHYFLNHEVLAALTPDPADQTRLSAALSDPENYVDGHARACEFLPVYGVALDGGDLLVSAAPCPKVLLHTAEKDTMWDLNQENAVLPILMGMQWE